VTPVKLIIAVLLFIFAILEISPSFQKLQFGTNKMVLGGALSGFFGGLSGIQGAIRSAFLIKSGLSKEAYIATGVLIASFVDITRLAVYASRFQEANLQDNIPLLISATASAIIGAVLGKRLLTKVTLKSLQNVVAIMLMLIAMGLGFGII
jgi:uncharacterized membrane protein YfcA